MPKPKEISVTEYALQTGYTIINIYQMIDSGKIKWTRKGKRTLIII